MSLDKVASSERARGNSNVGATLRSVEAGGGPDSFSNRLFDY